MNFLLPDLNAMNEDFNNLRSDVWVTVFYQAPQRSQESSIGAYFNWWAMTWVSITSL